MNNLHRLYQASPEEFCAELDASLAKIQRVEARLADCLSRVEAMAQLHEEFLRTSLSRHLTEPARSWTYDARLPNRHFGESVLAPEKDANGFNRWVRRDHRLTAALALPRAIQYHFSILVADFVSSEAEASFSLTVDGKPYPWMSTEGRLFKTVILEDPAASSLEFELFVDPNAVPDGKDVSFAFRCIHVSRRG